MRTRHIRAKKALGDIRPERKERVTVTLSRRSVEYVKAISTRERSHVSTVMDRMIESFRRREELKELNAGIAAFYDALPDAAVAEEAVWGETGVTGLAALAEFEDEPASEDARLFGA